jgi:hypothetical protein
MSCIVVVHRSLSHGGTTQNNETTVAWLGNYSFVVCVGCINDGASSCCVFLSQLMIPTELSCICSKQANGLTRYGSMLAPDRIDAEPVTGVFMSGCVISMVLDSQFPNLWAMRLGDTDFPEVSLCATVLMNETSPGKYAASMNLQDQLFGEPPCVTDPKNLPTNEVIAEFSSTQSSYVMLGCPGQVCM